MRTNIIILITAVAIFAGTLFFSIQHFMSQAVKESDQINELYLQQIECEFDDIFELCENTSQSFLTGLFYQKTVQVAGQTKNIIYVKDEKLPKFEADVYYNLRNFLRLNGFMLNAMFIVEPDVYPQSHPNGFAPFVSREVREKIDFAEMYDILDSPNYRRLKDNGESMWTIPVDMSPLRGKTITYYMPIYRENGQLFGSFVVDVLLDPIRNILKNFIPYNNGNMLVLVADENRNIVMSSNKEWEAYGTLDKINEATSQIPNLKLEDPDSVFHSALQWGGETYYTYDYNIKRVPWNVISICSEKSIYEDVIKSFHRVALISLVGVLLMILCCLYIFFHTRKNIRQRTIMESEINMAADLQMKMLKQPSYKCGSYTLNAYLKPAKNAGGDLYDYIEKDGHLIFCVGDVSGKGMSAALFMSQVCSLFRNAVRTYSQPSDIMKQINDVLSNDNPSLTFCTLFIGSIHLATGEIVFCNAGHEKPYINRQLLPINPNMPVGFMEEYPYTSETVTLQPDDVMILYSDGVTEAIDRRCTLFGEQGIIDTFATTTILPSSQECVQQLQTALRHHVNGAEQSDDITIVAIKRRALC